MFEYSHSSGFVIFVFDKIEFVVPLEFVESVFPRILSCDLQHCILQVTLQIIQTLNRDLCLESTALLLSVFMCFLQNFLVSERLVNRLSLFLDRGVGLVGSLESLVAGLFLLLGFVIFAVLKCLDGFKLVLHGGVECESFCLGRFFDNCHYLLDFLAFKDFIG